MSLRARLTGFGSYLPKQVVTNADLAERIETSDEWIRTRTGIAQRHIASGDENAVSMAVAAARAAISYAEADMADIGAVIVATATPDQTFPATAVRVQAELGLGDGFAFDVTAACSGFVYALATAEAFIRSGQVRKALVIGSEVYSRILDWEDRTTCVLFGDGAGAVLLEATEEEGAGILSTHLHSDGTHGDILFVDGPSTPTPVLHMQGREVFRHAVAKLSAVVDEALSRHGLTGQDIAWLVPHQANLRIIEGMAKKLALPLDRVVVTVDRHANTSAASIPLALDEAVRDGRIRKGDLVLLEALGGGLTWGSALLRM
ncbi:beta-ketoacyl-ACP synthase III [Asaia bogorensis]|uniref:beta-ketoacyl-ACP synthase III n=1 Tax=Asaia bogorensis TaxID=91915 RepID=UPI000EFD8AEC|nr:beta-ketoacyl-ACP synthase III [Asaia bogorensis]